MPRFDNIALPMMQGLDRFAGGLARGFMARGQIEEARRERKRQEDLKAREDAAALARRQREQFVDIANRATEGLLGRSSGRTAQAAGGAGQPQMDPKERAEASANFLWEEQNAILRKAGADEDTINDARKRQRFAERSGLKLPQNITARHNLPKTGGAAAPVYDPQAAAEERRQAMLAARDHITRQSRALGLPPELAEQLYEGMQEQPKIAEPAAGPPQGMAVAIGKSKPEILRNPEDIAPAANADESVPRGTPISATPAVDRARASLGQTRSGLAEMLDAKPAQGLPTDILAAAMADPRLPAGVKEGMKKGGAGVAEAQSAGGEQQVATRLLELDPEVLKTRLEGLADAQVVALVDQLREQATTPRQKSALKRLFDGPFGEKYMVAMLSNMPQPKPQQGRPPADSYFPPVAVPSGTAAAEPQKPAEIYPDKRDAWRRAWDADQAKQKAKNLKFELDMVEKSKDLDFDRSAASVAHVKMTDGRPYLEAKLEGLGEMIADKATSEEDRLKLAEHYRKLEAAIAKVRKAKK